MIGKIISHYKIIDKLGSGGMGDVYKAEDTKLHRTVALKFLPPSLTRDDVARQRFVHEARAASALDHPNIGTIYEINEDEEHPFISMAHYNGMTLKYKMEQGPLAVEEALDITIQIARGLEKAHSKEIIHRDIKPSNILITEDGQVKIIDFGLAKLAGRTMLTKTHTTLGTVAYMSPEQTQGGSVDHKSDMWALGVIFYEMLAGESAFKGDYDQAIMYSILNEDPEFITKVRRDVPLQIEKVINKVLNKSPDKRFNGMSEMLQSLLQITDDLKRGESKSASALKLNRKQQKLFYRFAPVIIAIIVIAVYFWSGSSQKTEPVAIALVPLNNISNDAEQEWFTDGMTDALITNLARIGGLRVISRSSVMKYKDSDKTTSEIAAELGVSYIIEGSVIRQDNHVKISTRLINTINDEYLWAHEYNRDMDDVLSLQGEVARAIADQIKVKLTPYEQSVLSEKRKVSPEAYEAYLKGNFYLFKLSPQSIETSLKYFEMARQLDPQYAQVYVGIALSIFVKAQMGYESINIVSEKAEPAVLKALELDSTIAEVYFMKAVVSAWKNWNWDESVTAFKKAIKLNPNYAEAHAYYSHVLFYLNQPKEALQHIDRAIKLDPFNALFKALYGMDLMYARQYDTVIAMLEKTLQTDPGDVISLTTLRSAYHQKKMYTKALETWKKYFDVLLDEEALQALDAGNKEGGYFVALQRVAELFIVRSKTRYVASWQIATLYTRAGMTDKALEWLEKAIEAHDPNMPYIMVDPIFDSMRSEERFQDLLHRLNFKLK
jgi:eukaryotic-like serine/threonine-protein kinase